MPPSVRFLGRRVYAGFVVVLKTAMHHGLTAGRIAKLGAILPDADRRTLQRWRRWWLENFVHGPFWKAARARFVPPLCETRLPLSLCERFGFQCRERLRDLLRFLSQLAAQGPS